jgi:REP element-mobilizing transposase RayT
MNRGDRRELIFMDDADRQRFVETLGEVCAKTGWQVHAYVLMPKHFHWVAETPLPNLVAGMKWLLGTCTSRFNRRHKLFGHLFSGRYKSLMVDGSGSGYLKSVGDYVHLNPARAKLVVADAPLKSFAWSSWPAYLLAHSKRPAWLRVDRLLGEWGMPEDGPAGRQRIERALEERRGAEEGGEFKPIRRGWCLGEEKFREELLTQMSERMGAETTMTVGWIAERMAMGTRGYLNHRLYRRRKLGGDCTISRTDPFSDPFYFPFFPLLPSAVAGRIGRLLGPLPIAGAAGAPLIGLVRFCWAP